MRRVEGRKERWIPRAVGRRRRGSVEVEERDEARIAPGGRQRWGREESCGGDAKRTRGTSLGLAS